MTQKPSSNPIESNLTDDPKIFLKYNSVVFCYHCNTKISITNASNHFIFTCTKSIAARKEKRKLALKQRRLAFNNDIKENFKLDFFGGEPGDFKSQSAKNLYLRLHRSTVKQARYEFMFKEQRAILLKLQEIIMKKTIFEFVASNMLETEYEDEFQVDVEANDNMPEIAFIDDFISPSFKSSPTIGRSTQF